MTARHCLECGKPCPPRRSKYCSESCLVRSHNRRVRRQALIAPIEYEIVTCEICCNDFRRPVGRSNRPRLTCSSKCAIVLRSMARPTAPCTVVEACHNYARETGLSIESALHLWGLA